MKIMMPENFMIWKLSMISEKISGVRINFWRVTNFMESGASLCRHTKYGSLKRLVRLAPDAPDG